MTAVVSAEPSTRWSKTRLVNMACGIAIGWIVLFQAVASYVHVGIDPQPHPCLPWRYYLVNQTLPKTVVRGGIYMYRAHGIPLMPEGVRVAKYAAALPGDRVSVSAAGVSVNGKPWGPLDAAVMQKAHMSAADVTRDYVVPAGKLLMLGTEPTSWDGRYWGLIDLSLITAKATPLW